MNLLLAREILTRPWAIDAEYAAQIGPALINFLEKGTVIEKSYHVDKNNIPNIEDINTVVIQGELFKNDTESGRMGMKTIGTAIQDADNNDNILGHILLIDSPGGTVDGTMDLVRVIKEVQKPVVAIIDGLAASAGYWIASVTDHIIALNDFAKVGSIGVMTSFMDIKPIWEKQGAIFHRIYADQSQDKNKDYEEILNGNYDNYKKDTLNPLAQAFIDSVLDSRSLLPGQYSGKTFFAKDVIGSMIDEIGSFDNAKNYIYNNSKSNLNIIMEKSEKKDTNFFARIFSRKYGVEVNSTEDVVDAQDKIIVDLQIAKSNLEQKITDLEANVSKLEKSKNETEQQLDTAGTKVSELETQVKELETLVEKLKQLPGAKSAIVSKNTDGDKKEKEVVTSNENSFNDNLQAVKDAYLK